MKLDKNDEETRHPTHRRYRWWSGMLKGAVAGSNAQSWHAQNSERTSAACRADSVGPQVSLTSSEPMATGYEDTSVPQATGCDPNPCRRLPDAIVVPMASLHS